MRPPNRSALLSSCLLAAFVCLPLAGQAQSTPTPQSASATDPVELEFWRSASSLNLPEAYKAYLERFPQGSFVALARIALKRIEDVGESQPTALARSGVSPELLAKLRSQPLRTDALEFQLGTRLIGPGVVTAGHWGAKRQLLVPFGEWILATAFDHDLNAYVVVNLTTLVLVKVEGKVAKDILAITFNRRSLPPAGGVAGNATPRWGPAEACSAGNPQAIYFAKDSDMRSQWCTVVTPVADSSSMPSPPKELRAGLDAAIRVLDLAHSSYRYAAETHVGDRTGAFTSYVHLYEREPHARLLTQRVPSGDVKVPANLSAQRRTHVLQQAQFAYHAAMAHQRQYDTLELAEGRSADEAEVIRLLGRDQ